MYCRNCAYQMDPQAVVCVKCGVPAGTGVSYCPHCGRPTQPEAIFCVACGASLAHVRGSGLARGKSRMVAGILGILLGSLGIHNFYLGFTSRAVAQLLISVLSCFLLSPISAIWGLVEGIQILLGDRAADAQGNPLAD